jgi:formamidopyrimidine-DNA glycosylase
MPELPEVETIRRGLKSFISKQKIHQIDVLCEKSFCGPTDVALARIKNIRRKGKALLIDLDNNITLMIHLRMTGQLIYRANGTSDGYDTTKTFAGGHPTDSFFSELPNRQTRVIFRLERGTLYFNDQRKFGFVKPIPTPEVEVDKFIANLGPEPWDLSPATFFQSLQRHKNAPIKAVILDQKWSPASAISTPTKLSLCPKFTLLLSLAISQRRRLPILSRTLLKLWKNPSPLEDQPWLPIFARMAPRVTI